MSVFSSAWFCGTLPTFCHNFQQSPQNFPHSNTEQIIYQNLKTSFLGPFSSCSNLTVFSFWPLYHCYLGTSICHHLCASLHLLLVLETFLSGSHVFCFLALFPHFGGTPFLRKGACEVNLLRNFLPKNIFILPLHLGSFG